MPTKAHCIHHVDMSKLKQVIALQSSNLGNARLALGDPCAFRHTAEWLLWVTLLRARQVFAAEPRE